MHREYIWKTYSILTLNHHGEEAMVDLNLPADRLCV